MQIQDQNASNNAEDVDSKEVQMVIRMTDQESSSWQKTKKCCKVYCLASMISLVIGLVIFVIAMGVALSNLTDGKFELLNIDTTDTC